MVNFILREFPNSDHVPKSALLQFLQYEYEVSSVGMGFYLFSSRDCLGLDVLLVLQNIEGQETAPSQVSAQLFALGAPGKFHRQLFDDDAE